MTKATTIKNEYLTLEETQSVNTAARKTKIFYVKSRATGVYLGRTYFYPQWRKYVFEPSSNTLYDAVCLSQIAGFIDALTDEWRSNIITARTARTRTKKDSTK